MGKIKSVQMMRPDALSPYSKKMRKSLRKINRYIKNVFSICDRGMHVFTAAPRFEMRPGCVIALSNKTSEKATLGYITTISDSSLNVCLLFENEEKIEKFEIKKEGSYPRYFSEKYLKCTLFFSDYLVDEFCKIVDEHIKIERSLRRPARITVGELQELKREIYHLKTAVKQLVEEKEEREKGKKFSENIVSHLQMRFE